MLNTARGSSCARPGLGCAGLTQISCESGLRKLKTPGVCFTGFLIIMEMPSDMKGLVKSMTRSRSAVIVMGAMAMSASCKAAPGESISETKHKQSYNV